MRSHSARGFYEKYVHAVHPLLLVVITVMLFSNTFDAYFLQVDDLGPAVHSSRAIRDVLTRNTYGLEAGGNYRPLENLPHMMDTHFYGHENPGGRRITNITIHTLNVLLVYALGACLTGNAVVGLIAGLLFVASPVHSQALPPGPWISGRVDLLVTFFYLLSVGGFITFMKKGSRLILFFASAFFMCALLSKEMAITLPGVLLLYLLAGGAASKDEAAVATSSNQREYLARSLLLGGLGAILAGIVGNTYVVERLLSPDGVLEPQTLRKIHFLEAVCITTGCLSVIYGWLEHRRGRDKSVATGAWSLLPVIAVLPYFALLRLYVLGGIGGAYTTPQGNVFFQFGVDSFIRDIFSLAGLVWPVGARYNTDVFALQIEHAAVFYAIGVLAVLALGVIFFALLRYSGVYSEVLLFTYGWMLITLVPVHNILLPSWQFQSRYLYLPAVGMCIFLSVVVHKAYDRLGREAVVWRPLVAISVAAMLTVNGLFLVQYNEKISRTGQMVRELVSSIRSNMAGVTPTSTIHFVTFPLSEIDTLNSVHVTAYMHEIVNYALGGRGGKYEYDFAVFIDGDSGAGCDGGVLESDGAFVLNCKGRSGYFFVPKERSAREREIERIWGVLPPHVRLQPLSPESGTQETRMAFIRMLDTDDGSKRVKIRVKLKEDEGKPESAKYVVYEDGHFVWR